MDRYCGVLQGPAPSSSCRRLPRATADERRRPGYVFPAGGRLRPPPGEGGGGGGGGGPRGGGGGVCGVGRGRTPRTLSSGGSVPPTHIQLRSSSVVFPSFLPARAGGRRPRRAGGSLAVVPSAVLRGCGHPEERETRHWVQRGAAYSKASGAVEARAGLGLRGSSLPPSSLPRHRRGRLRHLIPLLHRVSATDATAPCSSLRLPGF